MEIIEELEKLHINEEVGKQQKKQKKKQITEFDGLKATTTLGKFSGKKRERSMSINYNTLEEFMKEENKKIKTTAKKKKKKPNMQLKLDKERYSSID